MTLEQEISALSAFVRSLGFDPRLVVDFMQFDNFHRTYALTNVRLAIEQGLQGGMSNIVGRLPEGLSQAGFDHYSVMVQALMVRGDIESARGPTG